MSVPADIINVVFQLARHGLTEVAKNTQNTPSMIARAASALEQWHADEEQTRREPQPVDLPKAGTP